MSGLTAELRRELESHLSASAITSLEAGELALFVMEPECAFFRFDSGTYERADVYFSMPIDNSPHPQHLKDKAFATQVELTTAADIHARLRELDQIYVCDVAVGFNDPSAATQSE
ncbi:hypothetical protein [Halocatena pleomorpha]|uniref:Uncharacterized protein n=1 Tax=Halocatena pleomorpha TaxID=1785090 RepID=A0A3P3R984_9EURY|nr:hypothetical protein [Halocatena pleomorpha]RRJ29489.1 hypothetical protein EIK79_12680 [Halocatena pleomorpha]